MNITKHAEKRMRERLGANKKSIEKIAENAMKKGIKQEDTSGSLNHYFHRLYYVNERANNIRIYQEKVFFFSGNNLITVYSLPNRFKKIVHRLKAKK